MLEQPTAGKYGSEFAVDHPPMERSRHAFRPERIADIEPGQAAWVRCYVEILGASIRSDTYTLSSVLSVQAKDETITLRTPNGDMTVALDDCIHYATFAEMGTSATAAAVAHAKLALPEEAKYGSLKDLISGDPPPKAVQGVSGRIYEGRALCCMLVHHQPRKLAVRLVEWAHFDGIILCFIVMNCLTMAIDSPLDPPGTTKDQIIAVCEEVYLYVFTAELLIKVRASGRE